MEKLRNPPFGAFWNLCGVATWCWPAARVRSPRVLAGAATPLLNTLELAQRHGVTTAILGQGIGPIDDPYLRARAAKVLPKVDLICVRETVTGPPLLDALKVPREHVVVTGDDAIETVYANRQDKLGNGIGVNLRVSWYSDIPGDLTETLRHPLQEAARAVGAPLVSIPISRHPGRGRLRNLRPACSKAIRWWRSPRTISRWWKAW